MADIKVISGPERLMGKDFPIPANVRKAESVFLELAASRCFWIVNLSGLTSREMCEIKIMDFSARCVRSIFMGIPIFIDGDKAIVLSISKKSVDTALRKITNLLLVSEGNMIVVEDSRQRLEIKMVSYLETDDFADDVIFANA